MKKSIQHINLFTLHKSNSYTDCILFTVTPHICKTINHKTLYPPFNSKTLSLTIEKIVKIETKDSKITTTFFNSVLFTNSFIMEANNIIPKYIEKNQYCVVTRGNKAFIFSFIFQAPPNITNNSIITTE